MLHHQSSADSAEMGDWNHHKYATLPPCFRMLLPPASLSCLGIVYDNEFINVDEADKGVASGVLLQALVVGVALRESTCKHSGTLSIMVPAARRVLFQALVVCAPLCETTYKHHSDSSSSITAFPYYRHTLATDTSSSPLLLLPSPVRFC